MKLGDLQKPDTPRSERMQSLDRHGGYWSGGVWMGDPRQETLIDTGTGTMTVPRGAWGNVVPPPGHRYPVWHMRAAIWRWWWGDRSTKKPRGWWYPSGSSRDDMHDVSRYLDIRGPWWWRERRIRISARVIRFTLHTAWILVCSAGTAWLVLAWFEGVVR